MIFYIHGFASGKNSSTIKRLQNAIETTKDGKNQEVIGLEFDSSASFTSNLKSLKKQYDEYMSKSNDEEIFIVGTSLGGFYAIRLANIVVGANCTVFNPVVDPLNQLKQFVGKDHTNFATGEKFKFTETTLKSYSKATSGKTKDYPLTIFVTKNDELLDGLDGISNNYELVKDKYHKNAKIVYTNTAHRIDNFKPYVNDILEDVYSICVW